jgi:hypothetical protein
MGLPALYDLSSGDWQKWAFNHAAIHYAIFNRIPGFIAPRVVNGLQNFSLYPMDVDALDYWLYQHQTMHNQTNVVLGTTGYDLLGLQLEDTDAVREWLQLNGDEHQRFSAVLGV